MALRVTCGEQQQLLALQKAAAAERDCEIARLCSTTSARAEPPQQAVLSAQPVALPASVNGPPSHQTTWHEQRNKAEASEAAEREASEKHILRLRAALAASERQRERQAALHKLELEDRCSRMEPQVRFICFYLLQ